MTDNDTVSQALTALKKFRSDLMKLRYEDKEMVQTAIAKSVLMAEEFIKVIEGNQ